MVSPRKRKRDFEEEEVHESSEDPSPGEEGGDSLDEGDDESSNEADSLSEGDDSTEIKYNEQGLSQYEQLRLERIKRNEARLSMLGFSSNKPKPVVKKVVKRRPRLSDISDAPRRTLPGRKKKRMFYGEERRSGSFMSFRDKAKRRDVCWICQKDHNRENLVCCVFCSKLYHAQCHDARDDTSRSRTPDPGNKGLSKYPSEPKPKQISTAYIFFTNDMRPKLLDEGLQFVDLGKALGERWHALSPEEREVYDDKAAQDRIRYQEEMKEYNARQAAEEEDESVESTEMENAPKRPSTAYIFFINEMRPKVLDEFPASESNAVLGGRWRALSPEERKVYDDKAAQDKVRYQQEMKEYAARLGAKEGNESEESTEMDDEKPPKYPSTAYIFFVRDMRPKVHEEFPKSEANKVLGKRWRALSPEERKVYDDKADQDEVRYEQEMKEYAARLDAKASVQSSQETGKANDATDTRNNDPVESIEADSDSAVKPAETNENLNTKDTESVELIRYAVAGKRTCYTDDAGVAEEANNVITESNESAGLIQADNNAAVDGGKRGTDRFFRCSDCKHRTRRKPCGQCAGCLRQETCGSCVWCADAPEYGGRGTMRGPKCLFTQCLGISGIGVDRKVIHSKRSSKLLVNCDSEDKENAGVGSTGNEEHMENTKDTDGHSDVCFVCKDGGDLICCDGCNRSYHSLCHKPRIYSLDEEEWLCMVCNPGQRSRQKKEKTKFKKNDLVAELDEKLVKVVVVGPVDRCSVCNGTTGEENPLKNCKYCGESYHLNCHEPRLEKLPRGAWRCSKCKVAGVLNPNVKMRKKDSAPLFEGEHDDVCYMCFNGGDLLCCDYCNKAFHMLCHIPPLLEVPSGIWKCCECSALERTRLLRCGECEFCTRMDCGKCIYCKDKPKFGGPNKMKQTCIKRECPYKRFAPPSVAPVATLSRAQKKKVADAFKNAASNYSKSPAAVTVVDRNAKNETTKVDGSAEKEATKIDLSTTTVKIKVNGKTMNETLEVSKRTETLEASNRTVTIKVNGKTMKETLAIGNRTEVESEEVKSLPTPSSAPSFGTELTKIRLPKHLRGDPTSKKIQHIINGALRQPENHKVQDKACEVLRKIVKTSDDVAKVVELGGIQMIAKAMKEHPDKSILQAEACAVVAEIVWIDSSASTNIASEGCVHFIVSAMERFKTHAKLQQMGCGAFRALSYDSKNFNYMKDAGGVNAVLLSMNRNPKRMEILTECCYCLQNILIIPFFASSVVHDIEEKGILPIVVDAMLAHPDNLDFQGSACGFLGNVALEENMKPTVGNYCSAILAAVRTDFPVDVTQAACSALRVIALNNEENRRKISASNGIQTIFSVLRSSSKDSILAATVLGILKEFTADDDENVEAVLQENGFELIVSVMRSQLDSVRLVADGCTIFRHVVPRKAALAMDLARVIVSAMKEYPAENQIQFEGCHALLKLTCYFPAVAKVLNRTDPQNVLDSSRLTADTSSQDKVESTS